MASSSSSYTPSFSSQSCSYDVFLSFRGEDTRNTFVDHLYASLEQQGVYTYKDDETLPRGESIGSSLEKAIEESQIALIVFSKNYADSSWCLDELAHIMKCRDMRGQIVLPIFYDVDPSEVRKQKRKYGEAFTKHELENQTKVESWRKALVDASNIAGWEPKHIANGHESKCIKQIVDTVSRSLHPITSSLDDNLVGVEDRMKDLISKLQIGFGGKCMIGIWGVGGGGKTTLASSVYDAVSSKFDGCCFIKNIREESSNKNGLENLQAKILSGVLKQNLVKVSRVEEGRHLIRARLHHRKVLIVLDDIHNLEHLEALAGSHDWFGEGSRIIITTRDVHVLTAHRVNVIHNITLLNNDEAMKLFCTHAPQGYRHIEDYDQLLKDVVAYAGGLPLALRILGRFLCDKESNEWRSALARLKEIPDANILEVLKISFDGLTPLERELFLDIVCFFRRCRRYTFENIMMILDACCFHPVIGVKVLIEKALITISEDGQFDMHDLLQEMGHYIVRGEHPNNPEKHCRVWKEEDVLNISTMDATTNLDRIEAISFHSFMSDESRLVLQVAARTKRLRWIDLNLELLDAGMVDTKHPFMPNPTRELCCLTLFGLKQKQLWEGTMCLPNLRMIKLDCLPSLSKTPDFSGLPNLKIFIVNSSPLLEEIHQSFGWLENLVWVNIQGCRNLKMFPPITRSKKLETLLLPGCRELFKSSKIQQNMENFVPQNMNYIGLWFFSGCLRKLDLSDCNLADGDIISNVVWELPNLQELNLIGNRFVRLNFSYLRLPRLQYLNISYCYNLVELSELPSSIAVVIAEECRSLERFGDISNCKWLWKVSFQGYNKLGPLCGNILLDSMLQGKARNGFVSINLSKIDIWRGRSVLWVNWMKTYNMPLSHDWYNDYSGILMFVKCNAWYMGFDIIIKQGVDEDFQSEVHQVSNETLPETHYNHTFVGYVSFNSLRHIGCLNSTINLISFSLNDEVKWLDGFERRLSTVLVPKDDHDPTQSTKVAIDCSEFWDEKVYDTKTFTIQHDSNSSVKILWKPLVDPYPQVSRLFPSSRRLLSLLRHP